MFDLNKLSNRIVHLQWYRYDLVKKYTEDRYRSQIEFLILENSGNDVDDIQIFCTILSNDFKEIKEVNTILNLYHRRWFHW